MGSGDDGRAPPAPDVVLADLPACVTGDPTLDPVAPSTNPDSIEALPARFEVKRVVGRGGMGVVVAAYDRSLERDVAIKMLRLDHQGARARERFLREARAAAPLRDRGIVQVFDIDPDGKFIVMELVEGESLAARLERDRKLPAAEVTRIGVALAGALAVAHAAGIVHRDVKPSNLLLDGTEVKLADFGVALFADSELTAPGVQVGTPAYMAPEQLRGNPTDARADVYAAGATLFRAATGRKLLDGRSAREVTADVLAATGDRRLAEVIARAVRTDPSERFADGRAVHAALTSAAPRRRSLWAVGAAVAIAAGGVVWAATRDEPTTAPAAPIGLVAVEPIRWTTWSYAAGPPSATATGDVLAILLADIDGIRAAGATELANSGGSTGGRAGELANSGGSTGERAGGRAGELEGVAMQIAEAQRERVAGADLLEPAVAEPPR
jgi:predicted Ser/Thr protein kinase